MKAVLYLQMVRKTNTTHRTRPLKWVIALIFVVSAFSSWAQVKDINPNVQWKFVRSDSLPILEGATYQFKVPAQRDFDYILTFTHGESNDSIHMEVYNMQGALVATYMSDGLDGTSDLHFNVDHNATYEVKVRIGSVTTEDPKKYHTLLSLLKREKV